MDYEVKADPLAAAFDAVPATPLATARPALSGATMADPAKSAFIDGYVRRGSDVELKSFAGNVAADGGFAVPREIDAVIDATLKAISPIRAIANVVRVGSAGYAIDIDLNADGWVRVVQPGAAGRIDVAYTAGMASEWYDLPEPLRLAAMRLLGHLHAYRDDAEDRGPPAAVAALLRPWRRMRLA